MGGKCIAQTLAMEDFMTEEAIPSNRPCCVAAFAKSDDVRGDRFEHKSIIHLFVEVGRD